MPHPRDGPDLTGITPCRVLLDSGASGTISVSSDTRHWSGKG
jgi:hypothetical protein